MPKNPFHEGLEVGVVLESWQISVFAQNLVLKCKSIWVINFIARILTNVVSKSYLILFRRKSCLIHQVFSRLIPEWKDLVYYNLIQCLMTSEYSWGVWHQKYNSHFFCILVLTSENISETITQTLNDTPGDVYYTSSVQNASRLPNCIAFLLNSINFKLKCKGIKNK